MHASAVSLPQNFVLITQLAENGVKLGLCLFDHGRTRGALYEIHGLEALAILGRDTPQVFAEEGGRNLYLPHRFEIVAVGMTCSNTYVYVPPHGDALF